MKAIIEYQNQWQFIKNNSCINTIQELLTKQIKYELF